MTNRFTPWAFAMVAAALFASPASAACQLEKLAELPVTMTDMQPLVAAKVNGKDAVFVADSGDFFTQITAAKAAELGLKPGPAPIGVTVRGIGGRVDKLGFATAKSFTIGGQSFAGAFIVGGGEVGHDAVGLIGQNILGVADVEYDLAHGAIRLMRPHDCLGHGLAYWADGQGYSAIDIEAASARATIGAAYVNGVRLRAQFDSGASNSQMTLAAARRAGIDPNGPGVAAEGLGRGVGRHLVRYWIAPVDSFKVGNEEVRHTTLRIADMETEDFDMLLGADFFLSHRIYVANDQRKLYFTYNGGSIFNLDVAPASAPAGSSAAEPTDAAGFASRGAAYVARRQFEKAISDLTKAIDLEPRNAAYLYERARAYQGNQQPFLAMADLDKSLALRPDDIAALTLRASFDLAGHDKPHALADLASVDRLAAKTADIRLTMASLYESADDLAAALAQLDLWIAAHPEDARRAAALAQRCSVRGLANQALDLALADCDAALKLSPKLTAALDGRGLVRLRQGDVPGALADFEAALAASPKDPWALYGRGLARLKHGQAAEGKADLAAAVALRPALAADAKLYGLAP